MTLGLCYWILMLIFLIFGVLTHFGLVAGYGMAGNAVLLFILFLLVGWQVFGPPLHR